MTYLHSVHPSRHICVCHMTDCVPPSRYLVDVRWMKQWKTFVGFDSWDRSQVGEETANPGPINNKSLLAGRECVRVCVRACVCVCMRACMRVCVMCVCVCLCA